MVSTSERSDQSPTHSCLRYARGLPIQPERPSHFSCCFCINYSVQGLGFLCAQVLRFYWIRTSVNNTCWNFFAWKKMIDPNCVWQSVMQMMYLSLRLLLASVAIRTLHCMVDHMRPRVMTQGTHTIDIGPRLTFEAFSS